MRNYLSKFSFLLLQLRSIMGWSSSIFSELSNLLKVLLSLWEIFRLLDLLLYFCFRQFLNIWRNTRDWCMVSKIPLKPLFLLFKLMWGFFKLPQSSLFLILADEFSLDVLDVFQSLPNISCFFVLTDSVNFSLSEVVHHLFELYILLPLLESQIVQTLLYRRLLVL